MERNGIASKITGDNYRDYKKYLEIQKMNNGNNNFFLNNNGNTINNRTGNRINDNQLNQQNNQMNITANSTNSRVPFVYIPMNRPPSSDSTKKNYINSEDENRLYLNNNNSINNQNPNLSENLNENKISDGNLSNNQLLTEINNLK